MNRKIWAVVLSCCLCVSVLTACGRKQNEQPNNGSEKQTVSLVVWGAADDQAMLKEMVESFKSEHTDSIYEIEVRVNGENTARDEALKDIETTADVFAITNDQLGALVNANAVYENTVYADEIRKNCTESSVAAAQINGRLYGYPSSAETYFLYYDTSKLTEDDVESLEAILAKPLGDDVCNFGFNFSDAYFSSAFFLTAGCEIYGADGQDPSSVTFNSEEGIAAANYIAGLRAKGAEDMDGDVAGSRFAAGKLAAYVSGDWKAESYREALGENFGVAPLPGINLGGEQRDMVSFAGGKMYVVKSTTKYPVEAMRLAAWLTNRENQLKRFNDRNLMPSYKELSEHEQIISNPVVAAQMEQLEHSVATPAITQMSKYWDPVAAFTKDAFNGNISGEEIKTKLDTLVGDITA